MPDATENAGGPSEPRAAGTGSGTVAAGSGSAAGTGAGSGSGSGSREPPLVRQFVMDYLQQHGYDRVLKTLNEGLKDPARGANGASGDPSLEAFFVAPQPIDLDAAVQRNLPQAQSVSASTMSERITPEFEAQAKYIIEMMGKRLQQVDKPGVDVDDEAAEGDGESLLDTSERVQGYRLYRQWVDRGLDLWKPELDGVSFPLFAHTYLDLIHFGFYRAARQFFERDKSHHELQHRQDIASLSFVTTKSNVRTNALCQRLVNERYTVCMSRNSHDLLLQWLSGAGLDEGWEAGIHLGIGRAKEAIKAIVFNRINITVSPSLMPLDSITLLSSSGLVSSHIPSTTTLEAFNTATSLKLGPPPKTDRLKEQVARTLADADAEAAAQSGEVAGSGSAESGEAASAAAAHSGVNGTGPNGVAPSPGAGAGTGVNGQPNSTGHPATPRAGEDVEMDGGQTQSQQPLSGAAGDEAQNQPNGTKDDTPDPALVSPGESETLPPIPAVFRIADLKREVEAIRDKRRMIRLGPHAVNEDAVVPPATVLPSVVAYTVFDGSEGVSSVEFSHDSSLLAVGSPESCIRLWSMKGEKLKAKSVDEGLPHRRLIGHSGPVYSLSFDPIYGSADRPSALLSSSQDGTVRLWSMDTYSNLVVYRGHGREPVWDVEWGPMGVYFATASRDRTARLWSSDRVAPLRMYAGHLSDVNVVKFHPNSLYLATGSMDNTCRLWDVQRGACIRLFLGHSEPVTTMAISPDGKTLASAGLDKSIWLWDLGSSRPIKRMQGHKGPINSLSFSAESSVLVSGSADCTVRVWDVKSAGGERAASSARAGATSGGGGGAGAGTGVGGAAGTGGPGIGVNGESAGARGGLPMSQDAWDGGATADLMATYPTKRTPILKTHYTPRNLCMVAGAFVPPSNAPGGL